MDMEQNAADADRRGVPTFAVEAAVALLILVMGIVVAVGSYRLGSGWTSDGPGAGYFPFYIGLVLCISSVGALVQALRKRNSDIFADSEQLRRVLVVLVPALVYVLVVQFLGLYVASAIYIAGFMIFMGKYSPARSIATAVIIAVLCFLLFEVWFKVPLAKGSLEPLSFLGY